MFWGSHQDVYQGEDGSETLLRSSNMGQYSTTARPSTRGAVGGLTKLQQVPRLSPMPAAATGGASRKMASSPEGDEEGGYSDESFDSEEDEDRGGTFAASSRPLGGTRSLVPPASARLPAAQAS